MNLSSTLAKFAKYRPASIRHFLKFILSIVVILTLTSCDSPRVGNSVSESQENDLGRQYAEQIDSQTHEVLDGAVNRRVLRVAGPIFEQAMLERPNVSYRIRVIDDPQINAFSVPGGYVYIYKGLLDKLGTDDDALACVIAHESAHVVRRHVVKQMSDANGKGAVVDIVSVLARNNAVSQIGGTLYDLDQLHFSREDEYEADRWGERFAYNAGYDPMGMIRTFRMLQNEEQKNGLPTPYASDHPINRNRELRALEQYRELRANHGKYISEAYDPDGDRKAATLNGISYPALVLSTQLPTPIALHPSAVGVLPHSDKAAIVPAK